MNGSNHTWGKISATVFAVWLGLVTIGSAATNVSLTPLPDWVKLLPWDGKAERRPNEKSTGTRYLLDESQEYPQRQEEFVRVVLLMENETGVQDSGSLSFYFDSAYQELFLHRIQIHRDGQTLDRLDATKIKVIQPEPGLDGHMLTGGQSALVFVEDLRVGDVLEYCFTRRGANPVLDGHYSSRFGVQFGIPVDRYRIRLLWSAPKPLEVRAHLTTSAPAKVIDQGVTEYVWDFTNLTSLDYEDYLPASYEPYPYVEVSDFSDWARVVNWALPLYALPTAELPAELQKLLQTWRTEEATPAARALRALQFVQDEIRYTGLELGPDSYRPTPPFETFQKRFGDCKGKVALLCTMLRALDCEAWPALVNSRSREAIAQRLPSPFAFNHVIVKLNLAGATHWLDPTSSHQGGDLAHRQLPRFGRALVIQPGVTALEEVTPPSVPAPRQHVLSTFRLTNYEAPVQLTINSTYRGFGADNMREELARTDLKDLGKEYLNFYARYYASIEPAGTPEVQDDRANNVITITEFYRITNLWQRNERSGKLEADFWAESLYNVLTEPTTRIRTMPLRLTHPLRYEHDLTIHLPDRDWSIPNKTDVIDHEAFRFERKRTLTGATLNYRLSCETRLAELPAAKVADYLTKRDEMEEFLGESLYRPPPRTTGSLQLNWLMIVIAMFAVAVTAAATVGLGIWLGQRNPNAPALPPPLPEEMRLQGLGGWLVLVGIGLCVAPFVRLFYIGQGWESYFSQQAWQDVATSQGDRFHPLYGPLLIFELVGNIALLGLNLLAVVLFFLKRRTFPRVYIAMLGASLLFLMLDHLGCRLIPSIEAKDVEDSLRQVRQSIFTAMIWISYMLKSRRVRLTFVT